MVVLELTYHIKILFMLHRDKLVFKKGYTFIALFFIFPNLVFGQNEYQETDHLDSLIRYKRLHQDSTPLLISIDKADLVDAIQRSDKKYFVIYFTAWWCKGCVIHTPDVMKMNNDFLNEIDFYYINNDHKSDYFYSKRYFNQYRFPTPFLRIKSHDYKRNKWNRLKLFIEDLFPIIEINNLSLPYFIFFDKNINVISHGDLADILTKLNHIISNEIIKE